MLAYFKSVLKPSRFQRAEENHAVFILRKALLVMPFASLVFMIECYYSNEYFELAALAAGFVLFLIAGLCLRHGKLHSAAMITGLTLLFLTTYIATIGNGIYDLVMLAYPSILILMTFLLKPRFSCLFYFLTLLSLIWLVFGEIMGVYAPDEVPEVDLGVFIIVGTIIFLTVLLAVILFAQLRMSLATAQKEVELNKKMTAHLECMFNEKKILLKEVHHRVKNNLAVINSLLNLQNKRIKGNEDASQAFEAIKGRIYSMALVHERFYHAENYSKIDMADYVNSLSKHLRQVYRKHNTVSIEVNIDQVFLDLDLAIPCGMLINEILTNAFKHAFAPEVQGRISVTGKKLDEDYYCFHIEDDGSGFRSQVDIDNPSTMGLTLVELLKEQLEGQIFMSTEKGIAYDITFPIINKRKCHEKSQDVSDRFCGMGKAQVGTVTDEHRHDTECQSNNERAAP